MKKRRLRMDVQESGKIRNDKKREGRKSEVRELRYQNGKIKLGEVVEKRE